VQPWPEEVGNQMDDRRFSPGLLDMSDAARFLGIPRATFHRWARGYPRGGPLLHVLDAAPRQAGRRWAIIGRDVKIYERPWELEAYQRARVQVFLLPGQALAAELTRLVAVNLREIGAITSGRKVGTWRLTERGPEEYNVTVD
jgi:Putative DNA-binding HTH domain